jgi:hypothetical protein
MGIDYRGFDLHTGTDFTADHILGLLGAPADLVFSHPPYASMVDYTGIGTFQDASLKSRDTSCCKTIEDFLELSRIMLLNQREATQPGGHYVSLIGDLRSKGTFRSLQADFIACMPKSELTSVVIKMQHNCLSDARTYGGSFVPILHEYLLVWRKQEQTLYQVSIECMKDLKRQVAGTWRSIIRMALMESGGRASLPDINAKVAEAASEKLASNPTWQATVRRTLQEHYECVERGVWALAA